MKPVSKVALALVGCLLLSGCGSSKDAYYRDSYNGAGFDMAATASSNKTSGISGLFGSVGSSSPVQAAEQESWYDDSYDNQVDSSDSSTQDGIQDQSGPAIQKDMLVYRGDVEITTKDYEQAMSGLGELFETYDCFIESSREYTNYRYYDETDLMVYSATIRVNSKDYDAFMNGIGGLGVVSSKSSNVQNMNMEYSDTVTALKIQQARLDRYLERLETERDNEIALQLENQIAEIQIQLQQLESRKALIETDVAYSYIDLEIREVKAYSAQVTHDDPLYKRVWVEIVNTYYEFTEFLVDVLFFCIHAFPYFVILVIVWLVIRKKLKGKVHMPKLRKRERKGSDSNEPPTEQ